MADSSISELEKPEEDKRGHTRRVMRLETARQAIKLLDNPDLTLNERLKIMATIEKLTSGKKIRPAKQVKPGIFNE